jgi:phospholipase C
MRQIDGGKMDKFIAWRDAGGLVMSYYDGTTLPEGKLALQYTLCDNFFHAAFGGSFLNHQWLVSAGTPTWPDAPTSQRARMNADGIMTQDGAVTPDGYVVNTSYTVTTPHPAGMSAQNLVPLHKGTRCHAPLSQAGICGGLANVTAVLPIR